MPGSVINHALFALVIAVTGCRSEEKPPIEPASEKEPPPAAAPNDDFSTAPSAAAAVTQLLASRPRVVGFGEYHSTIGGAAVVSSLSRFRKEIFPAIAGALSDVVVETWVEPAGCGKVAASAGKEVKDAMKRPEETETEVFALLREVRERKLGAHILEMSCEDYASFKSAGELDYDKPLSIVTKRLQAGIDKAIKKKSRAAVAVYGGTMHNDVHPVKGFGAYSYAPRVTEVTDGGYLEIDLFVPELIKDSKLFIGQPWFEIAKKQASPDHVVVIPRGKSSYVVVLKAGAKASP